MMHLKLKAKAKEALTIVHRTVQSTSNDWMPCYQARVTTDDKDTPQINIVLLKRYQRQHLLLNLISVDDDAEYEVEKILKHHGYPHHF